MTYALTTIVCGLLAGTAALAVAQPAPVPATRVSVTPFEITREVSIIKGVQPFMPGRTSLGGQYTRRYRDWLAAEFSVDVRRGSPGIPGAGLAIADARFMLRDGIRPRDFFVTVGVAAGHGVSYGVSPMVGAGLRWHVAEAVAFRLEVQRFTRGARPLDDTGRLLLSLGVGLR